MSLRKTLIEIGLRDVEAKIYLAALELDEGTAAQIAKKAKIKRPSAYVILKDLIKKGFVSSYSRKKVTRFIALNPSRLTEMIEERTQKLRDALPELKALYKPKEGIRPRVQFYEGKKGLIEIMEDTLKVPNKELLGYANIDLAWNALADYYPEYIRKKNEQNITPRAIFLDSQLARRFKETSRTEKRIARLVSGKDYPISNEINIYDDKIFIISHKEMVGVIIESEEIANTQRAIFELAWERAKQLDPVPSELEK